MMAVHETGHILGALCTGGHIQHVVFHLLAFSRTDVDPNPQPLAVAWAGPLFGALLPVLVFLLLRCFRARVYVVEIFAAFCMLANGAYIGVGSLDRFGDAGDMLRDGSSKWLLWLFGALTIVAALWLFHRQGPKLGLLTRPRTFDLIATLAAAAALIAAGLIIDGR